MATFEWSPGAADDLCDIAAEAFDDEIRTEVMRSIKAAAPVGITKQLRDPVPRPRDVLGDPLFPRALDDLVLRLGLPAEAVVEHEGLAHADCHLLGIQAGLCFR